jgi:nicotinamide-nucleotide amidase
MNKIISIAESCTGGLLGHRITNIPMASKVFNGGLITYSNKSKSRLLGIPKDLIDDHGAVSEIVAGKMSEEVRRRFETDYGISITGIAGPGGGTKEKPVGTVFISISDNNSTKVSRYMFGKDREKNKLKTSQAAFDMLRLSI